MPKAGHLLCKQNVWVRFPRCPHVTLEELVAGAAGRIRKWLKATSSLHDEVRKSSYFNSSSTCQKGRLGRHLYYKQVQVGSIPTFGTKEEKAVTVE